MNDTTRTGRGLELIEGLGFEEVRGRLLRLGGERESANRGLAFYLADVAERRLYEDGGHSSAVHFAEAQLEMSARRARELIQVGRELRGLELVDDAFFAGDLGWRKVLLLLRVVQVSTQEVWIEFARDVSCRELDEEVRRCRPGETPGQGTRIGINAPKRSLHAQVDDDTLALLEQARAWFLERSGREDMTDSELLTAMAKDFVVQHELDVEEDEDQGELPHDNRNHTPIPADTRERVMARDRHRCRNCDSYRDPHIHHIEHRAHGGDNSLENLVVLCSVCHGLVHRHKLRVEPEPALPGSFLFLSASGIPVTRRGRSSAA